MEYLSNISRKTHEGLAVFYEWSLHFSENNKNGDYFIEYQKQFNTEYYGYIKPMLFIIDVIKKEKLSNDEIMSVFYLLFVIGVNCLSISVDIILDEKLISAGKYKKYISRNVNNNKLLPDKKFYKLLCRIEKNIQDGKTLTESICLVVNTNEFTTNNTQREEIFKKIKQYILQVFSVKKDVQAIKNILDDFVTKEISSEELSMLEIPMTIPLIYDMKKIEEKEIMSAIKEVGDRYTILILSGIRYKPVNDTTIYLNECISKIEKTHSPIVFYDLSLRKQYVSCVDNDNIRKILLGNEYFTNMVINYKIYDYEKRYIKNIGNFNCDVYIYCDRAFYSIREYIEKFRNDYDIHYTALKYKSMYIFIFEIYSKTYFIFSTTLQVFNHVCTYIEDTRPMYKKCIKDNPIDGTVIKDIQHKRKVDIIVDSIFFMGAAQNEFFD